ncbi:autotransporter outer membrane beta-barrel domain-containing protein [Collimonas humicola]|uniref:autotransporter outer membrane beta-barrel domain-containing protein n=1 Tax=Collimonas humicola TaxID=2825886 RepID=UPI001B8C0E5B|nr:autotransporter outer membrane beta-barrel domain-containing protein [Collimonas humicola]
MNKIHRVLWNEATGTFTAVAETTKSKGKRSSSARKLLATAAMGLTLSGAVLATDAATSPDSGYQSGHIVVDTGSLTDLVTEGSADTSVADAFAAVAAKPAASGVAGMARSIGALDSDITIPANWDTGNNHQVGATIINDGSTVNLTGNSIRFATQGSGTYLSLADAMAQGYVDTGAHGDLSQYQQLVVGAKASTISVPDPITGNMIVVPVYNDASFGQGQMGTAFPNDGSANQVLVFGNGISASPYLDARLATVSNGTVNVNLADTSINMGAAKQTALVLADGTQGTRAEAVWTSGNYVNMGQAAAIAPTPAQVADRPLTYQAVNYVGNFSVTDSHGTTTNHTVTNLASLQQYNNWLVQQMQAGNLAASTYDANVKMAYATTPVTVDFNPVGQGNTPDPSLIAPLGYQALLQADGANAIARVANPAGTTIQQAYGTTLLATNGGTVINDGRIGTASDGGQPFNVRWGGQGINNGVLTLGYVSTAADAAPSSNILAPGGYNVVSGSGSVLTNNGIINLGTQTQRVWNGNVYTVNADTNGTFVNNGAMNLGVINSVATSLSPVNGPVALSGGTVINGADGVIYLGRGASGDISGGSLAAGGADTTIDAGGNGMWVGDNGGGGNVDNQGLIVIGSGMQNANGIRVGPLGTSAASAINHGTIDVNGARSGSPLANTGIQAAGVSSNAVIDNAGIINLNGVNGIGVQAVGGGKATSSGTINVSAPVGADPTLPNYGLWADGAGSSVGLSGTVNLTGDHAIGVHARNGGNVAISGNGAVNFTSGSNQIGYFVYGPTATITNTGTGTQDVSSEGSTLFRMAAGAGFTGGAGAASQLTASGKDSVAVVVTGKDAASGNASHFNSGGMTINLTGDGATGVLVEGGAQGTIANTATINLNQANATAAVVDGQGHDLAGNASGAIDTTTSLTAGATLNSSLDGVTGYIAKNGASLTNSGNIVFTGANATGIAVDEGSTGANTGNITMNNGGIGLVASSTSAATTLNNSGNLILAGGSNANRTTGISADGSAVTVNMTAGEIDMQGQGAIGVEAANGATVNLSGTAVPKFAAAGSGVTDQIAFRLNGAGSSVNANVAPGTVLDASGANSTLFRLDNGASLGGVTNLRTSGIGAKGIAASGAGTTVDVASGSQFDVAGQNASAVAVSGGAHATLQAGVNISLTGNGAVAGVVDGNEYDLAGNVIATDTDAQLINNATLTSGLSGATALVSQNAGKLVNNGNITMTAGSGNTGIKVLGGQLQNQGNISVDGVAVYVEGANSVINNTGGSIVATGGEAAIKLGQDASLNLVGSGVATVTAQGTAHGVLIGAGAAGLTADGATINVTGSGNGIENQAEIAGMQLNNVNFTVANGAGIRTGNTLAQTNSGAITVNGSGAGIAFMHADGSMTDKDLDMSDSAALVITANAAGGHGIVTNTSGTVNSGASVNIANAAGGEALVIGGTTAAVTQSGVLTSQSTTAAVVNTGAATSFTNTGTIQAVDAAHDAFTFGSNSMALTNAAGATIRGAVALNGANNTVTNSGVLDGAISAGNGNNTLTVATGGQLNGTMTAGNGNNAVTVADGAQVSGAIVLGNGSNTVELDGTASVTTVAAGSGSNTFTLKGNGQTFTSLDGGLGAGTDALNFDGHSHTLSDASVFQNFEQMNLKNGSSLTLDTALKLGDNGSDVGTLSIDGSSTLNVNLGALNNTLAGIGVVNVNAGGNAFDFTGNVGNAFAGKVNLSDSTFNLAADNTAALTHATLNLGAGSTTTVGNGAQQIGGLAFNGGTAVFDVTIPSDNVAAGTVATSGNLNVMDAGTVQIKLPDGGLDNDAPIVDTTLNLLAQDDQEVMVQLVKSNGTVTGTAGSIALVDQHGNVISDAQQVDITQGGSKVAEATYDYRLMTGTAQDGLYVGYGLKQLDLQGTGSDALILANREGASGAAGDLSAKLTGSGDLAIDTGAGNTVSLSNGSNDYTGATDVRSGTLLLANNNALGQTSALHIANAATVDMAGHSQAIGALTGAAGSTLDLNGGALTIANGGVSDGALKGAGQLNLAGGTLTVDGANAGLSAATSIAAAASAVLNDVQGLGSGAIANDGSLQLNGATGVFGNALSGNGSVHLDTATSIAALGNNSAFSGAFDIDAGATLTVADAANLGSASVSNGGDLVVNTATDWSIANAVTGAGNFTKAGNGTLTAGDNLAYSGTTSIDAGTLIANGTLGAPGAGDVAVANGATLAGLGTVSGHVSNAGTISALNALAGHASDAAGTFTLANGLSNSGTINLAGGQVGNQLVVKGDYVGNNGTVVINTEFGGDNSATDKLVIDGGHASGDTGLIVKQAGGAGEQTNVGIQVVQTANGGTTNADAFKLDAHSTGYRSGVGTLSAGGYDYSLKRGGNGGVADDWYLVSAIKPVDPVTQPNPGDGGGDGGGDPGEKPVLPSPETDVISPEVGAYFGARTAATSMFTHTLHDRQGQGAGATAQTGVPAVDGNAWVRVEGSQNRGDGVGGLRIENSGSLIHGGADVFRFSDGGEGSVRIGAMAGYGSNTTRSTGRILGQDVTASGKVEGYGVGLYGTWYGNRDTSTGPYADAWINYGAFSNTVGGAGTQSDSYRSHVMSASLEGGYAFSLFDNGQSKVSIVPQAQVIYSNYRAPDHTANGTMISGLSGNSVMTRLGVRLNGSFNIGSDHQINPFIEENWKHGPATQNVMMNNNTFNDKQPSDRLETKIGLQGQLSKNVSAWGSLSVETGAGNYRSVGGQVGVKYTWK